MIIITLVVWKIILMSNKLSRPKWRHVLAFWQNILQLNTLASHYVLSYLEFHHEYLVKMQKKDLNKKWFCPLKESTLPLDRVLKCRIFRENAGACHHLGWLNLFDASLFKDLRSRTFHSLTKNLCYETKIFSCSLQRK